MHEHAREGAIAIAGCLATAGLDVEGGPHWLTASVGALTAIYVSLRIALAVMEIKSKRRIKDEPRHNR